MENLTGMAVFARVVEAGSFSAAAFDLGLSKSAVSKQVSQLEDRLGARLLQRTTRRLSLTEVGRVFHDHCVRMLAEADAAERAVSNLNATPRGLLKLNAPMSFGFAHIAPAIPEFLARHPDMQIDMTLIDRFVDLLEEGYDLAIRIAVLPDSSLVARRLAPNRFVIVGSPDYFARHGVPQVPEDLKAHNCIGYTNLPNPYDWRFTGPGGELVVSVRGNFATNNGDATHEAVMNGLGLARQPSFIAGPALQSGRLQTCLRGYMPEDSAVYAVYPHRRHLTPKVRAFVDFLAERFGPEPYWDWDTGIR